VNELDRREGGKLEETVIPDERYTQTRAHHTHTITHVTPIQHNPAPIHVHSPASSPSSSCLSDLDDALCGTAPSFSVKARSSSEDESSSAQSVFVARGGWTSDMAGGGDAGHVD
jgi:hypothetical protein